MILYDVKTHHRYRADKAKRPRMKPVFGRTWDVAPNGDKLIDGQPVRFWCDTSWSSYSYFRLDGQWYRIRGIEAGRGKTDTLKPDFDDLSKLTTKPLPA